MAIIFDSPKVKIKKIIIVAIIVCFYVAIFGKISVVFSADKMLGNELLISVINLFTFTSQLIMSGILVGFWIKDSLKQKFLYACYSMIVSFILFFVVATVLSGFVMQGWVPCNINSQNNCHVGLQWKP